MPLAPKWTMGRLSRPTAHEELQRKRRYSAPEFVSSEKKVVVWQSQTFDLISTSYVERLNATTRLHMRRLTRLTLAFSKKRENFEAAVACTSPITTSSSATIPSAALLRWLLASLASGALAICWRQRHETSKN